VHPHLNRGSVIAAGVEELAGVPLRTADEFVGVGEVDRLDAERAWRR
jgi:hypothetical protein